MMGPGLPRAHNPSHNFSQVANHFPNMLLCKADDGPCCRQASKAEVGRPAPVTGKTPVPSGVPTFTPSDCYSSPWHPKWAACLGGFAQRCPGESSLPARTFLFLPVGYQPGRQWVPYALKQAKANRSTLRGQHLCITKFGHELFRDSQTPLGGHPCPKI